MDAPNYAVILFITDGTFMPIIPASHLGPVGRMGSLKQKQYAENHVAIFQPPAHWGVLKARIESWSRRRTSQMRIPSVFVAMQLPLRATAAAILALVIAQVLQLPFPIYAFISAVIVTDLKPSSSRQLGLRRIWATVIGASCGAGMTYIVPSGAVGVGTGILVAMLLAQLLKAGEGVKVAGYISGIVLLEHAAEPHSYAFLRFVETVIGVLAAWGVSYIPKLFNDDQRQSPDSTP